MELYTTVIHWDSSGDPEHPVTSFFQTTMVLGTSSDKDMHPMENEKCRFMVNAKFDDTRLQEIQDEAHLGLELLGLD